VTVKVTQAVAPSTAEEAASVHHVMTLPADALLVNTSSASATTSSLDVGLYAGENNASKLSALSIEEKYNLLEKHWTPPPNYKMPYSTRIWVSQKNATCGMITCPATLFSLPVYRACFAKHVFCLGLLLLVEISVD
jgi:hypothetical protein